MAVGTTESPAADSSASSPGPSTTDAATARASALCTDLSTENQVDFSDVTLSLRYWDQVVADAPSSVVDQAQAVDDGFRKIADGMSPDDVENNDAINTAIGALESWSVDNCPG